MRGRHAGRYALAAALLAAILAPPGSAEVSVNGNGGHLYFHAEPGQIWTRHRQGVPTAQLLNPLGDARGDGAPSIARNPRTGAFDVAWGRSGNHPSVQFAWWDEDEARWAVMQVAPAVGTSPWAGRVLQLVHDDNGNRFIVFDDPETRQVVLASAPHDAHAVNRPIHISPPGQQAGAPAMIWDGNAVVIAYALLAGGGGIEIVELEPELDDEGRIPNGGEGVPGIPEPVFSFAPPRAHALAWPGGRATLPYIPPAPDSGIVDDPPAMTRVEALPDGRLLVTWIAGDHLGYTVRTQAEWAFQGWLPLPDPVDHEAVRADARRLLGGRNLPRR